MAENDNSMSCTLNSWALAALGGVVIGAVMFVVADWSFSAAAFLAVAIAVIVGLFLSLVVCSDSKTPPVSAAPSATAPTVTAPTVTAPKAAPTAQDTANSAVPAAKSAADTSAPMVKPSASLAGQAELAARKGSWKYEKEPEAKATASEPVAAAKIADIPPAAAEAPKAKRAAVAADGKPDLMDGPRPEGADDLKLISGVGPKLEQTLNDLGIWHFSQVAGWRKKEIAWVDERLRFKGRIERDDWMSQAKILAKGGETEFSKKKKK